MKILRCCAFTLASIYAVVGFGGEGTIIGGEKLMMLPLENDSGEGPAVGGGGSNGAMPRTESSMATLETLRQQIEGEAGRLIWVGGESKAPVCGSGRDEGFPDSHPASTSR